jgi:hypothetical protein
MNHKKSLVDAEASPSIHASIHRSLVSPTAFLGCQLPDTRRAIVHKQLTREARAIPASVIKFLAPGGV